MIYVPALGVRIWVIMLTTPIRIMSAYGSLAATANAYILG